MTETVIKEFSFQGTSYRVACEESRVTHPSWFSHVDESIVRDAKWKIRPGDCVFDVGASYGSYTLTALAAGAARAFAWSPQGYPGERSEASYLHESLELNGWEDRCDIYLSGCYDRAGWLHAGTQEFYEAEPEPNWEIIRVEPLDQWYEREFRSRFSPGQFPRYWLKLDVEGAEVEVLKTSERLIRELLPSILVELHEFKRPSVEVEVKNLLAALGYDVASPTKYHAVAHALYRPRKESR